MSIRSRLTATAVAAGAIASLGLVAPTAVATAAPAANQVAAQSKYFNIHVRASELANRSGCHNWSFSGSTRQCGGYYDSGHSAGFNNVGGDITFSGTNPTNLRLRTSTGAVIDGKVNGRGGGDFTITDFVAPQFGTLAGGEQKLHINVEVIDGFPGTGDVFSDFYLSGNLNVEPPAVSGTGPLGGLAGLFGSS